MGTLVLEDLNLVSLHALLKRLPGSVRIEHLVNVIGDREIFSEEQAKRIIAELIPEVSMHDMVVDRSGAIEATRKSLTPVASLTQTEEIYRILGEFHKRLLPGHERKGKFPMPQVGVHSRDRWVNVECTYGKRVKVFVSQSDSGQAFWPQPEIIDDLNEEQFHELLNRTRDWVFTEYQALGLKD